MHDHETLICCGYEMVSLNSLLWYQSSPISSQAVRTGFLHGLYTADSQVDLQILQRELFHQELDCTGLGNSQQADSAKHAAHPPHPWP